MKRLAALGVVSLAILLLASAAYANANDSEGPWINANPDAFTVVFSVYSQPCINGLYYYEWDVTLNEGATAYDSDLPVGSQLQNIDWIKGFYFDIPHGDGEGPVDNLYGPKTLVNGELVNLAWNFQPRESHDDPRTGAAGEWMGSGPSTYLYANQNGQFVAGVWLDTLFEFGTVYDVQLHVGNNANTGFVDWTTELTEHTGPPPPPPPTPELGTWLLLACTGCLGTFFAKRRKT